MNSGFVIFVIFLVALVSFSFGVVTNGDIPRAPWVGVDPIPSFDDNPMLDGYSPSHFNDTQMETALTLVAAHALREHTYSLDKGYVCADTAIDVWNLLYTQGIRATIGVGRPDTSCKDFECADHAWVIVRTPTITFIVETTAGEVYRDDPNDEDDTPYGYLHGMEFNTPRELKEAPKR